MQQQALMELKEGGNLVGNPLGRVEMSHIQTEQFLSAQRIRAVKLHRPRHVLLATDPEELRLNRVQAQLFVRNLGGKNLVIRFSQSRTGRPSIPREILQTVRNPVVVYANSALRLAHRRCDLSAGDAVLHPKFTDSLIGTGKREAIGRLGMGEVGGIKIQGNLPALGPVHPVLEVGEIHGIPIHLLLSGLGIKSMNIDPMNTRHERKDLFKIHPHLIPVTRLAWIVSSGLNSPAIGRRPT